MTSVIHITITDKINLEELIAPLTEITSHHDQLRQIAAYKSNIGAVSKVLKQV